MTLLFGGGSTIEEGIILEVILVIRKTVVNLTQVFIEINLLFMEVAAGTVTGEEVIRFTAEGR